MNDNLTNGLGVLLLCLISIVVYMIFTASGSMISRHSIRTRRRKAKRLCSTHVAQLEVGYMAVLVNVDKCEKCNRKDLE